MLFSCDYQIHYVHIAEILFSIYSEQQGRKGFYERSLNVEIIFILVVYYLFVIIRFTMFRVSKFLFSTCCVQILFQQFGLLEYFSTNSVSEFYFTISECRNVNSLFQSVEMFFHCFRVPKCSFTILKCQMFFHCFRVTECCFTQSARIYFHYFRVPDVARIRMRQVYPSV